MDIDSFIIHMKTEDFYEDIANDVEKQFDTSKYDKYDKKQLPISKNKKVIGLFRDELGGNAYLMDDDSDHKKAKRTKKCVIKRKLMFKNYIDGLLNNEIILQSQQKFKSDHRNVYTEQINKIVLSSNDDKRFQTFDKITTYP